VSGVHVVNFFVNTYVLKKSHHEIIDNSIGQL
jgi:hypothetical protein